MSWLISIGILVLFTFPSIAQKQDACMHLLYVSQFNGFQDWAGFCGKRGQRIKLLDVDDITTKCGGFVLCNNHLVLVKPDSSIKNTSPTQSMKRYKELGIDLTFQIREKEGKHYLVFYSVAGNSTISYEIIGTNEKPSYRAKGVGFF